MEHQYQHIGEDIYDIPPCQSANGKHQFGKDQNYSDVCNICNYRCTHILKRDCEIYHKDHPIWIEKEIFFDDIYHCIICKWDDLNKSKNALEIWDILRNRILTLNFFLYYRLYSNSKLLQNVEKKFIKIEY